MPDGLGPRYPSSYANHGQNLDMSGAGPGGQIQPGRPLAHLHAPLIPDQKKPWQYGDRAGAFRAFWSPGDHANFIAAAHNQEAGFTPSGSAEFKPAVYWPSADKREPRHQERKTKESDDERRGSS